MSNYQEKVIGLGDEHSEQARVAVEEANNETELTKEGIIEDGVIKTTGENIKGVITSIDGVGTKTQIYTNTFELLIQQFEEIQKKSKESHQFSEKVEYNRMINISIELWERMLHDLVAMNVDDLRNGEMAAIFTNIVDINSLDGIRGKIFSDTFPVALGNVIKETGINSGNGETAVLGESQKFIESLLDFISDRKFLLEMIKKGEIKDNAIQKLKERIKLRRKSLFERMRQLEFNIGGTGEGIVFESEKLVEMEAGQKIVYFSEKFTKDGIISPRSNGITRIRELMHEIAGRNWEMLTFEEFLKKIGEEKANKIPDSLKKELAGLRMWNIATGKTTVFNPFISKELLGGIDGKTNFDISGLIHITGNPQHKIASGIKKENLMAEINTTDVKIPQIIELLQHIGGISDEDAMSSWNMGTPYAIVCKADEVEGIIEKAKQNKIFAKEIGEVKEKQEKGPKLTIQGVGINDSYIEKFDKAA